jgi:uncharacterized membrane protein YfcA
MDFALSSLIVLFAAILHACTGFGFSVLATPFLLLVYPPSEAIQINIALSILISLLLLPKLLADIDRTLLVRLILGSLAGAPLGILIYSFADPDHLRAGIGIILLVLTVFMLRNLRIRRTRGRDFMTGAFSGALTSGLGMPGPPLMVYFAGAAIPPRVLRSTTLVCFLFIYTLSLILQIAVTSTSLDVLKAAGLLVPATVVGVVIGQRVFARIDAAAFMKLLYGLLIITGVYLVAGAVLAL